MKGNCREEEDLLDTENTGHKTQTRVNEEEEEEEQEDELDEIEKSDRQKEKRR